MRISNVNIFPNKTQVMKRREILKFVAASTGIALSVPLVLSLESCQSDTAPTVASKPSFFTDQEMGLTKSLVDTIMPPGDSPSASSVGVHKMIDHMVGNVYGADDKAAYKARYKKLVAYLEKQSKGKGFGSLTNDEKQSMLQKLLDRKDQSFADEQKGLQDIRQQTIAYYLNSEEIATEYLNYLPVPGPYEGCITLESVGGKAWAI